MEHDWHKNRDEYRTWTNGYIRTHFFVFIPNLSAYFLELIDELILLVTYLKYYNGSIVI